MSNIGIIMATGITINPELDARFRKCISLDACQKRGMRKRAAEEAIKDWCDKVEARSSKKETIKG
jgi:hypothetical protein